MVLKQEFLSHLSSKDYHKNNNFAIGLIVIFAVITLFGILNHAMWRDELNGWLIARDSSSFVHFFENIKYEGHPLLWYVLLWILNQITANPIAMQLFHWSIAVATISVFIIFSPFTKSQKILFTFGYLPLYEYSLISRNYIVGVLTIFLFCTCFQTRFKSYLPLGFILAIMANTNAYCLLISLALGLTLIAEYIFRGYFQYQTKATQFNIMVALVIFLSGIFISVFMLLPPSDSNLQGGASQWFFYFDFNRLTQTITRVWRSYILIIIPSDSKPIDLFVFSFFSLSLFAFSLLMLIKKPLALLFYWVGSLEILAFTYAKFLGSQRHYGHLYIILITALWIGHFYKNSQLINKLLDGTYNQLSKVILNFISFVDRYKNSFLLMILWLQVIAGIVGFSRDLITPYSSSKVAADFIKNNELADHFIIGSEDFTISPISGYLNQKIYYPETQEFGSYVLFNNNRKIVNDDDIINQIINILSKNNKEILLIMNRELSEEYPDLTINFIDKFTQSFIYNEKYYLYLVKSSSNLTELT